MKKFTIGALACMNLVLVLALALGTGTQPAQGQVAGGGRDYMMITSKISGDTDAVYVIDLSKRRMIAFEYDKSRSKLVPFRGRKLKDDFGRKED